MGLLQNRFERLMVQRARYKTFILDQTRKRELILLGELRRRDVKNSIVSGLFNKQVDFVMHPAKRKAAVCGRRAGKTYSAATALLLGAISRPESRNLYIATTIGQAKRLMWSLLKRRIKDLGFKVKYNENDMTVTFSNGSVIWVTGCPDSAHIEIFRGDAYYQVVIDEAASFAAYIQELVEDVLEPALLDYNGTLMLTGTPGLTPSGYFFEFVTSKDDAGNEMYPVFHWNSLDNPHLPNASEWIEERKRKFSWTDQNPTYRREILGEWVLDVGSLVYRLNSVNIKRGMMNLGKANFVLGVDLGASAEQQTTAFCVLAYFDKSPQTFVVESKALAGQTPSSIAEEIKMYDARFNPERIVVDPGGLGKGYIREFQQRYLLPIKEADKKNKVGYIELLNGDLRAGLLQIFLVSNKDLIDQANVLAWDKSGSKPKEHRGLANHLCDAMLYAWRECRGFAAKESTELPCEEEDEMEKMTEKRYGRMLA